MRSWPPVSTTSVQMFPGFSFEGPASPSRCLFPRTAQYTFFKQISPPGRRRWREHKQYIITSSYVLLNPEGPPHTSGKGSHPQAGRGGGTAALQRESRKVVDRLQTNQQTNPPLNCAHTYSDVLLHFKLSENQKLSIFVQVKSLRLTLSTHNSLSVL